MEGFDDEIMMGFNDEILLLFMEYLEDKMVGVIGPELLCDPKCFVGPEVGEGAPDHALIYQGGNVTILPAKAATLTSRGFQVYPHMHLTTEHALTVTRALAALHASTLIEEKNKSKPNNSKEHSPESKPGDSSTLATFEVAETIGTQEENRRPSVEAGCVKDRWTAQVTQLPVVQANLNIMVKSLQSSGSNERTVRRLEALQTDLPTLTQFLQFASAMQTNHIPSIGPVCMVDIWIPTSPEDDEETIAIRMRGGENLEAPPLRDAAWAWLTLLSGETLRDRYMELCDEYCNAFNKTLLRKEAATEVEEMSYFDVMRDLGENFLHAFLTVIHKYVVSGTWFLDRQLHMHDGLESLVDVISFLVDNGIVGSIFVM